MRAWSTIPILWCFLPKTGNSATYERITLLERSLKLLPINKVEVLLADREAIGHNDASGIEHEPETFDPSEDVKASLGLVQGWLADRS